MSLAFASAAAAAKASAPPATAGTIVTASPWSSLVSSASRATMSTLLTRTYLVLAGYGDLRAPKDPRRFAQVRALVGLVALAVNVITI